MISRNNKTMLSTTATSVNLTDVKPTLIFVVQAIVAIRREHVFAFEYNNQGSLQDVCKLNMNVQDF